MDQETIDRLAEIAEERKLEADAFVGFCHNQHIAASEAEDHVDAFLNAYMGEFDSEEEFAEYFADEQGLEIPEMIRPHIDWSDVWHCELRHDFYEIEGHYFRN